MPAQNFKRKLTAILIADVKGYSRLMGEDEEFTVRSMTAYREVIAGVVQNQKHQGRVVDSVGDNLLAEFSSVVDAVRCAVEIQEELKARNAELAENRRMTFRIGINLGDIIEEEGRIYGDGVNIAARVESLAEGGGICISSTVYEQVKNKLTLGYECLGEHTVTNITDPVGVYRVLMEPEAAGKVTGKERPKLRQWHWAALSVAIILVGGAVAIWHFYLRPTPPSIEVASVEKMAFPLPDKPSIAVLPFTNMSEDPKQDFFSDGITEEIITVLSKVPGLFVIARNSTFTYKGKAVKIRQVAEELGVRFVLEGSCRKAGDKVRITAQLIDAITGYHLWGERYERELKDIFAVQDEITLKILMALQVKLKGGDQASAFVKGTENLEAYLKLLKGREYSDRNNKEANALARNMYEEAIALDPAYAMAYLRLSATHIMDIHFGSTTSPKKSLQRALELVQKALVLDGDLAEAHSFLGRIYLAKRQYIEAIAEGERAIALAPSSDFVYAALAFSLHHAGRPEEAIALYEKAIRLNPIPPVWYLTSLASSYQGTGRYEESIKLHKKALRRSPEDLWAHLGLAGIYSILGREQDARAEAAEVLRIDPQFSLKSSERSSLYKNQADIELRIEAWRKAGLK